jgi:hypothetical protein
MEVLIPCLIGAASAFVVQFLIQFYIVPRVQRRKQREERWLKDVLDLGELLTTSAEELATKAWEAQQSFRMMKNFSFGPEYDHDKVQRGLRERRLSAGQDTWALRNLVNFRVMWVVDRIIALSGDSDQTFEFFRASYAYSLALIKHSPYEWEDLAEDEFDAFWDSERKLRSEMTYKVKTLSCLPVPPRPSVRRRLRSLRRKIAGRFTISRASKPLDAAVSSPISSS